MSDHGEQAAVVELRDAAVRVGGRQVWSDVSLTVAPGEFVALLGANGAGKSTLLRVLLGLTPASAGSVSVLGSPPGRSGGSVGYLPQRLNVEAGTPLRGVDIVRLGLDGERFGLPWPGRREREARARVAAALERVGASDFAQRPIGECSGGEQQRILIAQALVRRPRLLLLDEPLDGLDLQSQAQIASLVAGISHEDGVATILVAHDVNPLVGSLDRVVYLAAGRAVAGTVDEVVTGPQLSALYGVPVEVLRASDGRRIVVGAPDVGAHHHARHDHA